MNNQYKLLMVFLTLTLTGLACNLPFKADRQSQEVTLPVEAPANATEIPVTTQAVEEAKEEVKSVIATVQSGGPIQMEFTETQLTSIAAAELKNYQEANINNIQVRLQSGQIIISATAEQNGFKLPAEIAIAVQADGLGGLDYSVISATIGPFPVPEAMMDELTTQLDQGLNSQLDVNNVYIENVTIANGILSITGRLR
jgi:uncharacterized protein YpmS